MSPLPRSEHPRPDLQRERWQCLNGQWRFAFDPSLVGEHERWYRPDGGRSKELTATVPFPWESRLSGLAASDYKGAGWYEREITIPESWAELKPYLHFGAVDWQARVWLDGRLVAEHANGYLPFSCDLGAHLRPGESGTLTVRAYDVADASTLVGKQVPRWYTYSSGIWQPVWLEARPPSHVERVRITPDVERERALVSLTLLVDRPGDFVVRLSSPDESFPEVEQRLSLGAGHQRVDVDLRVPAPRLWSPESPSLYDIVVDLEPGAGGPRDRATAYFGMRTIGRGCWEKRDYEYVYLNGEPVYLRGALDQAFHPDGLHAYPSDDVIRGDIQLARDLGLNTLRCHIKVNDPRYYYWADRLGVMVMYDIPCADLDTPSMRRTWEETLRGAVARDYNHPSIVAWVLFNETWGLDNHDTPNGQAWVRDMYRLAKELDPTRLVEDNSACRYDHVSTDLNSWHFYIDDYAQARRHVERVVAETYPGSSFNYVGGEYVQGREPLLNSEYAGISARMGDLDISWSLKHLTTELRRYAKICGYVYTELADIEWEHNGFVNYDRTRKEFGYDDFVSEMSVRDLTGADFVGLDAPPCQSLLPGGRIDASVFVSNFGREMRGARVRWQLDFDDRFGARRVVEEGTIPCEPRRFDVVAVGEVGIKVPEEPGLATLAVWLEDGGGEVRARNYVNAEVRPGASPRIERTSGGYAIRFAPGDFVASSWDMPSVSPGGDKLAALGPGWVEYELAVPKLAVPIGARNGKVSRLSLRCEAGARAGLAKVGWPARALRSDYPQTEEAKYPSDLRVLVCGVPVGELTLADDPADARGALSHYRGVDPGSYGYLVDVSIEGAELEPIREVLAAGQPLRVRFEVPADAARRGGLALYGETLGRYPLDPTILLDVEQTAPASDFDGEA